MDGYQILNFTNFPIRIGYGYSKNLSDMDQELKNQYPLTSAVYIEMRFHLYIFFTVLVFVCFVFLTVLT